eukprot:CAMPEP_0114254384 /NCGR_PEP_ID=MMETSP0058-20121206/16948_1 /TAXON_ID=36894 /ORGANISM="Pyramimonas parkeae, CCMP726" /LENGTH=111 /DNA_ID=CAMNT_0001368595 /DNA_START=393 /DNA_END=728 /DNA_ORIENTATION=-
MATTLAQARLPLRATNNQPEDHSAYFEMAQPRAVLPSWKEPEQNVQGDLWSGLPPTKPVNAQAATKSNWTRQQQLKPGEDRTAGISSAQYESSRFTSTGLKIVRDGWGRSF